VNVHARVRSWRLGWLLGVLAVALTASVPVTAQERFTAIVARTSGAPGSDLKRVEVNIDRYTSDEEARELSRILTAGGQQPLLVAVRTRNLGSIVIGDGPPRPVHAARATVTPAGRRIVVATARPVASATRSQPSSADYPFQIVEFNVDADGHGSGRLTEEAGVSIDALGALSIASYMSAPQTLIEVSRAPR